MHKHTYFDLANTPSHIKAKIWKDTLNEFFYRYDAKLAQNFNIGKISGIHVAGLSVASVESDAMSVWRTKRQIAHDGIDSYFVLLPTSERIALVQRGRTAQVSVEQCSLVSTSESYEYIQTSSTKFNNLIIPGKLLRQLAPNADDVLAKDFGSNKIDKIFIDFANAFCNNCTELNAYSQEILTKQIVELLGLTIDCADELSSATPIMSANRRRILKFIEAKFTDPNLDIAMIAHEMQFSPRYIQLIFHSTNETVSSVIRKRRILAAYQLLRLRKITNQSVTQIAFEVGFKTLSHFSRVFREDTGFSPSDISIESPNNVLW